jgi:hypothetical protein
MKEPILFDCVISHIFDHVDRWLAIISVDCGGGGYFIILHNIVGHIYLKI